MGLVLLTGGARSGKTRMAVDLARRQARPVVVVATAEPGDNEMVERIRRHREERPSEWTTVEEPLDLEGALRAAPDDALVVIDCLTLWVANLLGRELPDEDVETRAADAAGVAATRPAGTIAVTNEVGASIVPDNALGRRFRDLLGRVNGLWADAADRAGLVVAGRLLPLARPEEVDGWTPSS